MYYVMRTFAPSLHRKSTDFLILPYRGKPGFFYFTLLDVLCEKYDSSCSVISHTEFMRK